MAHERGSAGVAGESDAEATALLTEMARIAAAALESHEQLSVHTTRERDRLAVATNARPGRTRSRVNMRFDGRHRRDRLSVTG